MAQDRAGDGNRPRSKDNEGDRPGTSAIESRLQIKSYASKKRIHSAEIRFQES